MKNYTVISLKEFDDIEETKVQGKLVHRKVNDIFDCTKERFEYLRDKKAVELVMIHKKGKRSENNL